ncbi:MAG: hypothetical protein SOI28_05790 [Rahnella inusitata]|jgi:hypothetical protein|uniref:hypothetical protein n=1 Tax=Rahnella woolbedingensis TaxID=1510574 RepID=UPI00142E51F3|nr:hypothetical protein [Rahnella woolbedingensis]
MQVQFKDVRYNRVRPKTKAKYLTQKAFLLVNGDTEQMLIAALQKLHPNEEIELISFKK